MVLELPKYDVVLQNDDRNPFAKVILALNLFAGLPIEEATKITIMIHEEGSARIGSWHLELAETIMKKLNDADLTAIISKGE